VGTYWIILIRDIFVLVITWLYVKKVDSLSVQQRLKGLVDGERETHVQLFDLSSVILSVLPY